MFDAAFLSGESKSTLKIEGKFIMNNLNSTQAESDIHNISGVNSPKAVSDKNAQVKTQANNKNNTMNNLQTASNNSSIVTSTQTSQYEQIKAYFIQLGYKVGDRVFGFAIQPEKTGGKTWVATLGDSSFDDFAQAYNTKGAIKRGQPPENPRYIDESEDYYLVAREGLEWLNSLNDKGYNIFVHVNGEITQARIKAQNKPLKAYFFEWDDKTKDEMWNEIKSWSFQPSMVIDTGNKSLHVYFVVDENENKNYDDWKTVQCGLIETNKSDKSIKDLARNLRLPSFKHPKTGNFVEIKEYNNATFTSAELVENFDIKTKTKTDKKTDTNPEKTKTKSNKKPPKKLQLKNAKLPKSKLRNKKWMEQAIETFLEDYKNKTEKREPEQGIEGRISTLYDEHFQIMAALKDYYGENRARIEELMSMYFDDTEGWKETLENLYNSNRQENKITIKRLFDYAKTYGTDLPEDDQELEKLNIKQLTQYVEEKIELSYNSRTQEIEYFNNPISKGESERLILANEHGINASNDDAKAVFAKIAFQNEYDPVVRELEAIEKNTTPISIENLSSRYFGTSDPFYDLLLKKWLVALVKRAFEAGCKFDGCLVLQGDQGVGKSTFLKILATGNFEGVSKNGMTLFCDNASISNDKDNLMKINASWIVELAEIEDRTSLSQTQQIKRFITNSSEKFRLPYASRIEEHPRACVFAGTCNNAEFLNDPTGNRRFWVIPLEKSVDFNLVREERDGILASAVKEYRNNYPVYLSPEETTQNNSNNQTFEYEHPWQGIIADWLSNHQNGLYTLEEITRKSLENKIMGSDPYNKKTQSEVKSCLQRLGLKMKRQNNKRYWENTLDSRGNRGINAETPMNNESQPATNPVADSGNATNHLAEKEDTATTATNCHDTATTLPQAETTDIKGFATTATTATTKTEFPQKQQLITSALEKIESLVNDFEHDRNSYPDVTELEKKDESELRGLKKKYHETYDSLRLIDEISESGYRNKDSLTGLTLDKLRVIYDEAEAQGLVF